MTSASQECIPVLLDVTRWRSADILGGGGGPALKAKCMQQVQQMVVGAAKAVRPDWAMEPGCCRAESPSHTSGHSHLQLLSCSGRPRRQTSIEFLK